jgi:hypothetical protein
MNRSLLRKASLLFFALSQSSYVARAQSEAVDRIDFKREIRPILSDACFKCHGPDAENRQADLRLDNREAAFAARDGGPSVVPGQPSKSEVYRRITSSNPDQRMPPIDSGHTLSAAQIELFREWIEQGADWQRHWSFVAPRRDPLAQVRDSDWPQNEIDYFILSRLENAGLRPSQQAGRRTLVRRLSLDLVGLPPTPQEVDAFVADERPDAYEKVVDRLLASPRYGERMALDWLDAARYADTHGYHEDYHRDMWPWRDWVINAFNSNMPFDQFTIEQLAGDLLPGATKNQIVATGFNRNHGVTASGISEEYRVEYVLDRVRTTSTVWLGLTMECAQCHDHKYDPISQAEFYQFYAYFNTITDKGVENRAGNVDPIIEVESPALAETLESDESSDSDEKSDAKLTVMVMQEMKDPRSTFVLKRGQYDQHGRLVTPGTPTVLPPQGEGAVANRLALAKWLVRSPHPLTSRVAVNRMWQMAFGAGIVKTSEDFGAQGELPSHPQLLDWLATEFSRGGWNVKQIMKQIVTSATYQQASQISPAAWARDPENRLLSRGARFRMPAELIRDNALAISGLLVGQQGGRSVKPYQPQGLWKETSNRGYEQDHGSKLYRRSVYTYWKRSVPPPNMFAIDAPTRETCTVRRQRTNTPLMALVMLNDPTFVEAARVLAQRAMLERADQYQDRIALMFEMATARRPEPAEQDVLLAVYQRQRDVFRKNNDAGLKLLAVGESERVADLDPTEHAALTAVASIILNLDETITKE